MRGDRPRESDVLIMVVAITQNDSHLGVAWAVVAHVVSVVREGWLRSLNNGINLDVLGHSQTIFGHQWWDGLVLHFGEKAVEAVSHVLPRCLLPPCAAAFHPHLKQALASSFRVATAERQAEPACPGVVHPIGVSAVSLEVGNSCVHRTVLANTLIETRPDQFLQNIGCCAAAVEQDHFQRFSLSPATLESLSIACAAAASFSVRW